MMNDDLTKETIEWYKKYYNEKGNNRNDLFNPEVLMQELAYKKAFVNAFRGVDKNSKILDIGGGGDQEFCVY